MLERLQKIIARAGIASRRHAEELILAGSVTVNGKVVTELGTKADAARDHIRVGTKLLHVAETQAKRYYVLHKPPQVVATMSDPEKRPTLRDYLHGLPGRVFPVGRLEYHASGLLLLMNDGELANLLLRNAGRLPQTYRIKLKGKLTEEARQRIEEFAGARIRVARDAPNAWYEVELEETSRDHLRRALAENGHLVERMIRVALAGIDLENLPPGSYRTLTEEEVRRLRRACQGHATAQVPRVHHAREAAAALRAEMSSARCAPRRIRGHHDRSSHKPLPGRPGSSGSFRGKSGE